MFHALAALIIYILVLKETQIKVFLIMIKLTFPSNNHVTSGGGSPVMLTSSVSVRPTFTTRFCKLVRSIVGFTERKFGHYLFYSKVKNNVQ